MIGSSAVKAAKASKLFVDPTCELLVVFSKQN